MTFVDRVSDSALRLPQPERAFTPTLATGMPRATLHTLASLPARSGCMPPNPPAAHQFTVILYYTVGRASSTRVQASNKKVLRFWVT